MRNIESPRLTPRNRERSSPPIARDLPVFDDVVRIKSVIDVKSNVGLSTIKDPKTLIGHLYEEEYIKTLFAKPKPQRVILTSHVIDRFYCGWKGIGSPDMLEFAIEEVQGGCMNYRLVGEAEVRSGKLDMKKKLQRNGKFLKQADSANSFMYLLRSVGENPEEVIIPKAREIQFTIVSPNNPFSIDPRGIPDFRFDHLPLPLPEIPSALAAA